MNEGERDQTRYASNLHKWWAFSVNLHHHSDPSFPAFIMNQIPPDMSRVFHVSGDIRRWRQDQCKPVGPFSGAGSVSLGLGLVTVILTLLLWRDKTLWQFRDKSRDHVTLIVTMKKRVMLCIIVNLPIVRAKRAVKLCESIFVRHIPKYISL